MLRSAHKEITHSNLNEIHLLPTQMRTDVFVTDVSLLIDQFFQELRSALFTFQ